MEKEYAPDLLKAYVSGTTFDIYCNCNSKFRELQNAKKRNDSNSVKFWEAHIKHISEITNLLYKWFYSKEHKIRTENDFKTFIESFKRYCQIKYKTTWFNLITGKFTNESLTQ